MSSHYSQSGGASLEQYNQAITYLRSNISRLCSIKISNAQDYASVMKIADDINKSARYLGTIDRDIKRMLQQATASIQALNARMAQFNALKERNDNAIKQLNLQGALDKAQQDYEARKAAIKTSFDNRTAYVRQQNARIDAEILKLKQQIDTTNKQLTDINAALSSVSKPVVSSTTYQPIPAPPPTAAAAPKPAPAPAPAAATNLPPPPPPMPQKAPAQAGGKRKTRKTSKTVKKTRKSSKKTKTSKKKSRKNSRK